MRLHILAFGAMLAALTAFGCSDEAEFSIEELCNVSGGTFDKERNICECDNVDCAAGIVCIKPENSGKYVCADSDSGE